MNTKKRIVAFHLLNDRSGSPKVLSQIIKGWVKDGRKVKLYTSLHQEGFLSDIAGVDYQHGWYHFKANPWMRLLYYTLSQVILFFSMFREMKKSDIIYINTILPFGAALLGKLKGCRVIYHIHESTVNPVVLKWFLFKMVSWTASDIIDVSKYVEKAHQITKVSNHLVYNAIDESFLSHVRSKEKNENPTNVLMVCSLKAYKGVYEFVQLSTDHPQYSFRLVLNATQSEIDAFFEELHFPENIKVCPSQKNLHPFYFWADVIVNLSRPDGWIETFGLTIIEGMAYGLPAIVPPVGGILELIKDGVTGFSVDSRDYKKLNMKLMELMDNPTLYKNCSNEALKRLNLFKEQTMLQEINSIIQFG